jgi:hypothetical protein
MKDNQITNSKKSQIFFLFSIISALSFGIDITSHQIYNLSELFMLRTNASNVLGTYGFNFNPINPMYYYLKYIVPILEYGSLYILSSLFIKFFIFTSIYKLSAILVDKTLALFTTIIFLLAYLAHSHGVVEIGFWGELGFFPAVISSLITVWGLNSFLKENYIRAGFQFSISIIFHPLYGFCTLSFLSLGLLIMLIKKKKVDDIPRIFLGFIMVLLTIGYIAFFRMNGMIETPITHSFIEWYTFSIYTDPADMSLLFTIKEYGYLLLPIFLGGLYSSIQQKEWKNIECLTIGSLIFFILCVLIETLHLSGIFFETFSELFIASQFRRGIWITSIFCLLAISKNIYTNKKNIFKNNNYVVILIYLIATYIFPSIFSVLITSILILVIFKNLISSLLLLISICMTAMHYSYGNFDITWQIKLMIYCLIFTVIVTSAYFSILFKNDKSMIRLSKIILTSLCLLFVGQGILKSSLYKSVSVLTNNGLFEKTQLLEITNHVKEFPFDQSLDQCMINASIISYKEKIQLPISGPRNTKNPLFSFNQVFGYYNPMYSRQDYQESKNKLRNFFGRDIIEDFFIANKFFNKKTINEYFLKAYNNLPEKQLVFLRDKENLRFYLVKNERSRMEKALICNSKKYFVYDLSLLLNEN